MVKPVFWIAVLLVFDCSLALAELLSSKEIGRKVVDVDIIRRASKDPRWERRTMLFSKEHAAIINVALIKNNEEWSALDGSRYREGNRATPMTFEAPNFEREMVLGVAVAHAGGIGGDGRSWEALIQSVEDTGQDLLLQLGRGDEFVGGGCGVIEYWHFVSLPKRNLPIRLRLGEHDLVMKELASALLVAIHSQTQTRSHVPLKQFNQRLSDKSCIRDGACYSVSK